MKSKSSLKFCVSYICLTLQHMNCIPSQKHCDGWCDRPFWVFSPRKMRIASGQQHVFCFKTTRDKEFNQTRITSSRRLKISKHWLWQLTWFHNHIFSYSFIMMWGIYLVSSVRSFCLTEIHMAMCRLGGRVQTCKMILNCWISSWQKCLMHDDWWPLLKLALKKRVVRWQRLRPKNSWPQRCKVSWKTEELPGSSANIYYVNHIFKVENGDHPFRTASLDAFVKVQRHLLSSISCFWIWRSCGLAEPLVE